MDTREKMIIDIQEAILSLIDSTADLPPNSGHDNAENGVIDGATFMRWLYPLVDEDGHLAGAITYEKNDGRELIFEHSLEGVIVLLTQVEKAIAMEFDLQFAMISRTRHLEGVLKRLGIQTE